MYIQIGNNSNSTNINSNEIVSCNINANIGNSITAIITPTSNARMLYSIFICL